MKLLVVLSVTVVVMAVPPPLIRQLEEKIKNNVEILTYENYNNGFGNYRFAFVQSDGNKQGQLDELKNKDSEIGYLDVTDSFTWVGPDGVTYKVTYVANEEGYQPEIEQGPGGAISPGVLASLTG